MNGFWDWTIGDVAAVITLGAGIAFAIWGWVLPWAVKKWQNRQGHRPIELAVEEACWERRCATDEQLLTRETDIRLSVFARPRWKTSRPLSNPSLVTYTARINGEYTPRSVRPVHSYGLSVARKTRFDLRIPLEPNDLREAGEPRRLELEMTVQHPPHDDRQVIAQFHDISQCE